MVSRGSFEIPLGKWSGTKQLCLSPAEESYESASTAAVSTVAQGQFVTIAYTWALEDQPQDGLIIFRADIGQEPTTAVWLDSWHMRNDVMICQATMDDSGVVSLQGSYAAPPGPDWGWRIEIETAEPGSWVMRMINIAPEGQEALAVQAQFQPHAEGSHRLAGG